RVALDAVDVREASGERGSAAGSTQRVGDEAICEAHAGRGQPIHIRCAQDLVPFAAHLAERLVVRHDVENVRAASGNCGTRGPGGEGREKLSAMQSQISAPYAGVRQVRSFTVAALLLQYQELILRRGGAICA